MPARVLVRSEGAIPPGPYRLVWPVDQGGLFEIWGRQGTPPDFTDGWAIPFLARCTQSVGEWLVAALNATPPASETLDVERLARAMHYVTVEQPGLLSDVDMLNDPTDGDPRPAAEAVAAEYARLAEATSDA